KMMGERVDGGSELLDAAVAMSVPYDLAAGCDLLERSPMGRADAAYFLRSLRGKVRAKAAALLGDLDPRAPREARTLRRFDHIVTARPQGVRDAAHHDRGSSGTQCRPDVALPTLLLHAADDPFHPTAAMPRAEVAGDRMLQLLLHP